MDTYDGIETDQDGINLANIIHNVCHIQDNNKQYIMAAVKTNKHVYLFFHGPRQSNSDYLEGFKYHLKLSKAYNGAVGYHRGLDTAVLLENHNITSDFTSEEQKIKANIKAREKYPTCTFLIGADNLS